MKTYVLEWGTNRLELGPRTLVMGILKVTPTLFQTGERISILKKP